MTMAMAKQMTILNYLSYVSKNETELPQGLSSLRQGAIVETGVINLRIREENTGDRSSYRWQGTFFDTNTIIYFLANLSEDNDGISDVYYRQVIHRKKPFLGVYMVDEIYNTSHDYPQGIPLDCFLTEHIHMPEPDMGA